MQNEVDKVREVAVEMMRAGTDPETIWGVELAAALMIWYETAVEELMKIPDMHRTQCMAFFELGRRYERKWPQNVAATHAETDSPPKETQQCGTYPTQEQVVACLEAREAFAIQYGKDHGWDEDRTTWDIKQILEVREQPEWKEPKI